MIAQERFIIETPRLNLVCCTKDLIEVVFKGDEALAEHLQITVPTQWTEFGEPAFRWTYDKLSQPNAKKEWWAYLPILKTERVLVGSCGYKGEPTDGVIEIGYEIAKDYRNKGLATEIAKGLIAHAFQYPEVTKVQAHTLAKENESGSVLKKAGMTKMEELEDPEDGKIWRWEINR